MKIIIDGFGGDNAPLSVLQGSILAQQEYGIEIVVTGDKALLTKCANENNLDISKLELYDANGMIAVTDDPGEILKDKSECSMGVGLKLLADGYGDAFVSAGSTGALVVGATFIVKRIKGIKRTALAPIIPSDTGNYMLIDSGANLECRPEMLLQFGLMGSAYMNKIMNVSSPRVGLINVGTEDTKGSDVAIAANSLLKNSGLNFIGNVEAREIPAGTCDVVVADGYAGNIILKLTEGLGSTFAKKMKGIFMKSIWGKLAAMLVMKHVKEFKKSMDYTEHGGAPLMGTAKPVIKAHGSSNAKAFKNAIRQAISFVDTNVIGEITKAIAKQKEEALDAALAQKGDLS